MEWELEEGRTKKQIREALFSFAIWLRGWDHSNMIFAQSLTTGARGVYIASADGKTQRKRMGRVTSVAGKARLLLFRTLRPP